MPPGSSLHPRGYASGARVNRGNLLAIRCLLPPVLFVFLRRYMKPALIHHELQFCWNVLVADHSTQFSPFRPCLCRSVIHAFAGSSSIVDPRYLKDWTLGKLTISVSILYLFILTGSVSPVVCRCSVFALLTLSPLFSIHYLHLSSLSSIISLSGSHNTRSSANSIAQGVPSSISSVITSIMNTNNSGLSAEPWWSPTSIYIPLVFLALVMTLVLHPEYTCPGLCLCRPLEHLFV